MKTFIYFSDAQFTSGTWRIYNVKFANYSKSFIFEQVQDLYPPKKNVFNSYGYASYSAFSFNS